MELRIGFANKYYTLWEYSEEVMESSRGKFFIKRYKYRHNLSFDKERAFAKFPEAVFDETLVGRRGSWSTSSRIIDDDKFHVGKYANKLFTEVDDYDYMMWFANNCCNEAQKSILIPILINQGYGYIPGDSYLKSPKDIEEYRKEQEKTNYGKSKLEQGIPFIVTFTRNLNDDGEYFVEPLGITVKFPNFNIYYYEGFPYGLPCDNKGKGKRIKNRQVMIGQYIADGETVIVTDWKYV